MKSLFKINSMKTLEDVSRVRNAISSLEGVMACQVSLKNGVVNVVYDDFFIKAEDLILSIEDSGYTVLENNL